MVSLQRVLLVDDEYFEFEDKLNSDFKKNNIDIRFCDSKDDAMDLLNSGIQFDLIILDWFLEEDNDLLSRLFLKQLKDISFLPVFIWSHHIANYNESIGEVNYPQMLITGIAKEDVSAEIIENKTTKWFEDSLTAQISKIYRQQIRKSVENIFFELLQVPNQDIASLLKFIVGDGQNIDWSNDFILNLLHRRLIYDKNFCDSLKKLLFNANKISKKEDENKRKQVLNKVLYYTFDSISIHCGDIVQFQNQNKETQFGIVVTPDCDLEQKQTRYIELVELKQLDDSSLGLNNSQKDAVKEFKNQSLYFLPAILIEDNLEDFVAIFKAKIILKQDVPNSESKYPKTSKRLEYSDSFVIYSDETKIEFICRLDNPYKSDFLQKFHAHNSRVGIPDIRELL